MARRSSKLLHTAYIAGIIRSLGSVSDTSPPVGELGPLHIDSFGVLVAFGIFVGVQVLKRRSVRARLDVDISGRLLAWALVGRFLGAVVGTALVLRRHRARLGGRA
ncbi:hypothetical protein WME79_18850 [Sorangium sp. So ce726]|uniref:hypothetical protein n=1 Tax=Sorangium sp. So ce726 TaxID=3133319 RepID=UPI003F639113